MSIFATKGYNIDPIGIALSLIQTIPGRPYDSPGISVLDYLV